MPAARQMEEAGHTNGVWMCDRQLPDHDQCEILAMVPNKVTALETLISAGLSLPIGQENPQAPTLQCSETG